MIKLKKLISFTVVFTLIISVLSFNANASDNSWTLPDGVKDDNTIRFALLADSHIVDSDAEFKKAVNAYKNFDIDLMVLNGDIVNNAKNDTTYELMKPKYDIVKNVLADANISTVANTQEVESGKIPLIFAMGNHEFPQVSTDPDVCLAAINVYETEMGCKQNSHTVINGIHFITSGGDTYDSFIFHQEEYLTTELEKALADTPQNQPVFLVIHHPIYETVHGSDSEANKKCSVEFKNFLKANPQIIVLSAHTHVPAQHPKGVWQDGFSAIGSGYIGGGYESHSDGLLVEVNDNIVSFYKMNFKSGNFVGEPWVIDVTSVDDYVVSGWESTKQPMFSSDAKITVSNITTSTATLTWNDAIVTPTPPYQDNFVERYRVRVYDEAGNIVYLTSTGGDWFNTDYYFDNGETTTTLNVAGLKPDSKYSVKIVGQTAFGRVGNELRCDFKTPKSQYDGKVFETLECDTRISTTAGRNDYTNGSIYEDIYATEGKSLRHYGSAVWHTWNYTPKKSGIYTFELVADGTEGQYGTFEINDEVKYDYVINATGKWNLGNPQKTVLCKTYMEKDRTYKLEYYCYGVINMDYFNIYFEDVIESEKIKMSDSYMFGDNVNSLVINVNDGKTLDIPVNIESKGMYSVSLMGTNNSKVSVRYKGLSSTYTQLNGDGSSLELSPDVAILNMDAGENTISLNFKGDYVLDYVTIKQLPDLNIKETGTVNPYDIVVNAETDYDIESGHGVGWYDSTPNTFDEKAKVLDGYGWLDIRCDGTHYEKYEGSATAVMMPTEWFKYNVNIENDGYYRLLLGLKYADNNGEASDFKVVVNGDDSSAITKSVHRTNIDLDKTYDDFGLVWLNKGENTFKVIYTSDGGYAELDALRLVSPDVGLYEEVTASGTPTVVEAEDYVYLSGGSYVHIEGLRVIMHAETYIDLKVVAEAEGYYDITMVAQADQHGNITPYANLKVNDVDVSTVYVNNDDRWDSVNLPRITSLGKAKLNKGENTIRITNKSNGGILCINYIEYVLSSTQRVEAEDYKAKSDPVYTHDSGLRVIMTKDNYIELVFDAPSEDYYDITMVAQANESETITPYATLNVNGVDIKTQYVNNDNKWDCVASPRETIFENVKLKKGENTVRITYTGNGGTLCINYFDYAIPPKKIETAKAGTYDVIAKLGNWYSGGTLDDKSNRLAYGKEYKPVFYMPVYDAYDNYVKTYMSDTVNDSNNITFKDVTLTGGETLYFMIWDKDNLKPLMTKRALEIAISDN